MGDGFGASVRWRGTLGGSVPQGGSTEGESLLPGAPVGPKAARSLLGRVRSKLCDWPGREAIGLDYSAVTVQMVQRFRKKIIGHRVCILRRRSCSGALLGDRRGTFALLNKPAGDHRRSVLIQPLIEQGANLLAKVGGVIETRQFIRLQRIA